jgi:hypothetical protein
MDTARRVVKEFSAEIRAIKKTSKEYGMEKDPPPCPSVMVNNRFIAKNDTITYEALKTAIISDSEVKETA